MDTVPEGSTLDDIITDTSAEVVIARSWDGLNWSVPEVSSPRDEKRRQMDLLPFVFTDAATRQLYLSWTSSRSNSLGNILLRNMASEQSVYSSPPSGRAITPRRSRRLKPQVNILWCGSRTAREGQRSIPGLSIYSSARYVLAHSVHCKQAPMPYIFLFD